MLKKIPVESESFRFLVVCLNMIKILPLIAAIFIVNSALATELYSEKYDPNRDPFVDGRDAIALAKKTNRRILIEVGGDWCKWCHLLDRFIKSDPQIKKALHETFVVLKVNVSDENSNEKFLASFPKPLGYPHMYITESDGRVVHSQDTAEFLTNLKYSKNKFLRFLQKWKLKPTKAIKND